VALTLPAPDDKAAVVRTMFDRIAPRYERLNTLLTFGMDRGWRRAAITAAALVPGDVVVDVACGTGDLAALAAAAGARVVGVDFAAGMLAHARRHGVPLVRADACALPLPDASAQAITCGFALRNFVAIRPMLQEAARVLGPGGRLVLLEVAEPRGRLLRWGHRLYFHRLVPLVGAVLSDRQAYAYLPASAEYLPAPAALRGMIVTSGFTGVRRRLLGGGAVQLVAACRSGAGEEAAP
jgi:demethylmenaquinone methyltransferase/2-methoxy-6-polyprenyl-1,4-benzoquinol methylase